MIFKRLLVLLVAGLFWQCTSALGESNAPARACSTDLECGANGACIFERCAKACTSSEQCNGGVCGIAPNGTQRCVPPCQETYFAAPYDTHDLTKIYACVDGVSTACSRVDGTHCEACGCDPNLLCTPGVGCGPKRALGEACTADSDCKSDNCSDIAGVCRVPVGQPCDPSNCDQCYSNAATGFQYCSRTCSGNSQCNGGACLGQGSHYRCFPSCSGFNDTSCPGQCRSYTETNNRTAYYCSCDCTVAHAPQAIGTPCQYATDCASNFCQSESDVCPDPFYSCSSSGFCSAACSKSADCPAGYRCGSTNDPELHCLPVCDKTCKLGECTSATTAEGDQAQLCQLERETGYCRENRDCISNKCVKNTCAPSSSLPNGQPCVSASDCQSMYCRNNACSGHALLGDACSSSFDCSVGTCCTEGASKGMCGMGCI